MAKARRRVQAPKARSVRNYVAVDALGITDGNRRKTRFDNDSRRQGTRYAVVQRAMSEV